MSGLNKRIDEFLIKQGKKAIDALDATLWKELESKYEFNAGHKVAFDTSNERKKRSQEEHPRVVLGDLSTLESRYKFSTVGDDDVKKVVKKLIENNLETMSYCEKAGTFAQGVVGTKECPSPYDAWEKLKQENEILKNLLPQPLTVENIKSYLNLAGAPVVSDIKSAKSDGQATGMALKWFKQYGHEVNSNDVITVVKELRCIN